MFHLNVKKPRFKYPVPIRTYCDLPRLRDIGANHLAHVGHLLAVKQLATDLCSLGSRCVVPLSSPVASPPELLPVSTRAPPSFASARGVSLQKSTGRIPRFGPLRGRARPREHLYSPIVFLHWGRMLSCPKTAQCVGRDSVACSMYLCTNTIEMRDRGQVQCGEDGRQGLLCRLYSDFASKK